MSLIWKAPAFEDLKGIRDYISIENPAAALRVAKLLRESASKLIANPYIGRVGTLEQTRELVVTNLPYILVYQLTEEDIEILRVVHTSRLWSDSIDY